MDCSWIGWCALKPEAQAAWAQAILTALTFAGTVLYQGKQNKRHEREARLAEKKQHDDEVAMAQVIALKEYRRWRRAIRKHFATQHADSSAEAIAALNLAAQFSWEGDVRDIKLLGKIGHDLAGLICYFDAMQDDLFDPSFAQLADRPDLDELVVSVREKLENLDGSLSRAIETLMAVEDVP